MKQTNKQKDKLMNRIEITLFGKWKAMLKSGLFHIPFALPIGLAGMYANGFLAQDAYPPLNSEDLNWFILMTCIVGAGIGFVYGVIIAYIHYRQQFCSRLEHSISAIIAVILFLKPLNIILVSHPGRFVTQDVIFFGFVLLITLSALFYLAITGLFFKFRHVNA